MNVLHLHLSDEPAVRIQTDAFPELTEGLNGQFYTKTELRGLIGYAKARGVMIEPEIDVPAHSGGFKPLVKRGLRYIEDICSSPLRVWRQVL